MASVLLCGKEATILKYRGFPHAYSVAARAWLCHNPLRFQGNIGLKSTQSQGGLLYALIHSPTSDRQYRFRNGATAGSAPRDLMKYARPLR